MRIDYETKITTIDGKETDLKNYIGDVLLVVNTASFCGYTNQYSGLETLYSRYKSRGFSVLGFPCKQFAFQEPGTDKGILEFCTKNYSITFPMFSKIKVNGVDAHPLFQQLKDATHGLLGKNKIQWNFNKFLIGRDGSVLARYGSSRKAKQLEEAIEEALQKNMR